MTTLSSSTSRVEMPDRFDCHCHVDVDPRTSIPEGGLKSVLFIEGVLESDRGLVAIGRTMKGHFVNYRQILEHTMKVKVEKAIVRGAIASTPSEAHECYGGRGTPCSMAERLGRCR